MREAIERVIAELDNLYVDAEKKEKLAIEDFGLGSMSGRCYAYSIAIIKLKEVLNTANHNTRNPTEPERDGQQKQSQ